MNKMTLLGAVCLLVLVTFSQGLEECPDKRMVFNPRTYSCYKFNHLTYSGNYSHCRNKVCPKYKGGIAKNMKGCMARILDKDTNNLLKRNIPPDGRDSNYLIGLNSLVGRYRWEGFPHDEPTYYDWAPGEGSKKNKTVFFTSNGWVNRDKKREAYCLCEVPAVIPPVSMNTKSPLQEMVKGEDVATCSFSLSTWTKLSWSLAGYSTVVTCTSGSSSCQSDITEYSATIIESATGSMESKLQISNVSRRDEGPWKCVLMSGEDENVGEASSTISVYSSAREIVCNHKVMSRGVGMDCTADYVYPKCGCEWHYKYGDEITYQALTRYMSTQESWGKKRLQSDGTQYFDYTCSVQLEPGKFKFRPGSFYLKFTVYPFVERQAIVGASTSKEVNITIVLPDSPKFRHEDKKIGGYVSFVTGDEIHLTCVVYQGVPRVYKTNLKCDFPFLPGHERKYIYETTWKGKSVVWKTNATGEMDGKKCYCSGKHLTGDTDSTELLFKVQSRPTVTEFTANSESQSLEVEDGDNVTLSCKAQGNPRPSIVIRGQRSKKSLTLQDTYSGDYIKTSEITMATTNKDTDTYICIADNGVGNSTGLVSVFVKCSLELLGDHDVKREFKPISGATLVIDIAIFGYPQPMDYILTKPENTPETRNEHGDYANELLHAVTYVGEEPARGSVMLIMVNVSFEDSGEYVLAIKNGIGSALNYSFDVTVVSESISSDDNEGISTSATIGIAVGCALLLIIVAFILGMQVGKRKFCQEKKTKMLRPSPDYDESNVLPLQEAYGVVDSIQIQEVRRLETEEVEYEELMPIYSEADTCDPSADYLDVV